MVLGGCRSFLLLVTTITIYYPSMYLPNEFLRTDSFSLSPLGFSGVVIYILENMIFVLP